MSQCTFKVTYIYYTPNISVIYIYIYIIVSTRDIPFTAPLPIRVIAYLLAYTLSYTLLHCQRCWLCALICAYIVRTFLENEEKIIA